MNQRRLLPLFAAAAALFAADRLHAELKLAPVIGENMVLQQGKPLPVWGWDEPGTEVTVAFNGATATAKAGSDGKWTATLPPQEAGGPHALTVKGTQSKTFENVLVGEVWFCSGQSNMEWTVQRSMNAEQEIAAGDHPKIRHLKIPHVTAETPQSDVPTEGWKVASPQTVAQFTAVGYYFALNLQKELDVPVGLVGCNWGGTRIEPWTPPVGFKSVAALKEIADNLDQFPAKNAQGNAERQSPLALYNGMVAPLIPYAVRGFLWYQGESNNGEGMLYFEKKKALINGWRTLWKDENLPFYFVQLAPFNYRNRNPEDLPGIWEAQVKTLSIPHTGMAVTADIGDVADIHPVNKQEVGRRLSLWALAKQYGRDDLVYSGPLYKSHEVDGNKIRIAFEHVADGLASRDGKPLSHFEVAGEDMKFVDAKAEIDGTQVLVGAEGVDKPVAVRFAWDHTAEPNLSNSAGLPASPFRTDE